LAGVVLNPGTPVSTLNEVLDLVDQVLIMSVNPGFGGQHFIPNALKKVQALAWRRKELGLNFVIEIDGGVELHNAGDIVRSGCDWLVAGTSVFHTPDPAQAFVEMQRTAREAALVKV
jgi:ribulose-phosphate 3-epimerase